MKKENLKILVFAPHSAIWVHAFPEAVTVEALQKSGHQIIYITCGEVFKDYCICMSANRLEQSSAESQKKKVCETCGIQKNIIRKEFNFQGYDLSKIVSVQELEEIETIINQTTPQNFLELRLDNIEIGRTALYEILLQYKKYSLDFSPNEWSSYLIALKNTLISFFASRRILDIEKPDRVLTYNSVYSVNRICCQLAQARGITTYFLHAGGNLSNRLQTMILGKGTAFKFNQSLKSYWQAYKDVPCSQSSLELVTNHFLELFKGQHFLAYSSAKNQEINIRDFFYIQENQKILVATMSSYDERFAGEEINEIPKDYQLIFPKQIDWIRALIDFISQRQDLFLIIRVHPREFPNKRDNVKSEHGQMLEKILIDLPENIKVNYPTDQISIYNLAMETNVFLNAWSSVGEEMSLFGIPVIIYSPDLVSYPSDLNYLAASKEDLCVKIDQALLDGWNFERIRKTYRWYCLKLAICNLNLSDSIFWKEEVTSNDKLTKNTIFTRSYFLKLKLKFLGLKLKIARIFNEYAGYTNQIKDCQQRSQNPKYQNLVNEIVINNYASVLDVLEAKNDSSSDLSSLEQETKEICVQLKRLMDVLYEQDSSTIQPNTLRDKLLSVIQ